MKKSDTDMRLGENEPCEMRTRVPGPSFVGSKPQVTRVIPTVGAYLF